MRILYVQYTNPAGYPPLEHSSRILANAGWQVLFLSTAAVGARDLRFPPHPNVSVKSMPFCQSGWRQKIHYASFCLWVLFWVVRWQPHWIYASDMLACPIAWLLTLLPGQRVIYHEHDSPGPRNSLFARLCLSARRRLAQRAEVCALPNKGRAQLFAKQTGRSDVLCVWNCPRCEEVSGPHLVCPEDSLWVLYHGSVVPHRLPTTVITALAKLPDSVRLLVVGYETAGHTGYLEHLRREAERLGVADRLEIRQAVPRYELLRICRTCHVGLALVPRSSDDLNFQSMIGASNKPFDYLACGLALLVSDLPDWRQMYVEPGYALACDPEDPQSIAHSLRWLLDHREEARAMGERARQRIAGNWNYETQFHPVWQRLEGMKP
jgi:glycosyltransferase involved in cell wall biosynthesis